MPITPDLPFPKSAGDAIRSKDWNDLVVETQRLDNAKVDRGGDTISGNLSVSGSLGVKTATPRAPLHVRGAALISDADGYAVPNNHMQSGSLTIGSITRSFGGGTNWNSNTAGLLLETLADTEIAVYDSGTRVASVVRYESATNSLTIGRDMGWGAIDRVVVNGNLGVRTTPFSGSALHVSSTSRAYGIYVTQADTYAIYAVGDTYTSGRAIDNKIHTWISNTNRLDTTSTAWTDIPSMSITISLPRAAYVLIMVQINGVQMQGGTTLRGGFRLLVDGSQVQQTYHEFNNSGWELRGVNMSEIRSLAAGSHTIKVQWMVSTGTMLSCCWYNDRRHIQIIELS